MGSIDKMKKKLTNQKKRMKDRESRRGSFIPWLRLEADTTTTVRILKDAEGEGYFEFFNHYNVKTSDGNKTFTCLKSLDSDSECPICDLAESLQNSDDADDKKYGLSIMKKDKTMFLVIDVNEKGTHDRPLTQRFLSAPDSISMPIFDAFVTSHDDGIDLSDPNKGRNFNIKRTGSQWNDTEYTVNPQIKEKPLAPHQIKIIKNRLSFKEALEKLMLSPEEINVLVDEISTTSSDNDDDSDSETPGCYGSYEEGCDDCDTCAHSEDCSTSSAEDEDEDTDEKKKKKKDDDFEDQEGFECPSCEIEMEAVGENYECSSCGFKCDAEGNEIKKPKAIKKAVAKKVEKKPVAKKKVRK